ncbi:MAG: NAD(P)/FAD-dependent oxidoreductase [Desulfomicrobium sp.]|nr:NAD(P)/FAD-dependent oxidoreductase [Pseudomonadota bacterium]MBV1711499.1 NAD(P)/FAD-dependent oxidoreductase [Desulfomicrobium sp.]MBU4572912.1 NAD(P)/FAD-dependent oxidoreductase [Pseudomonadota bacterium]MBU4594640.1 NAD(P)/FAD-dependent oxidoreductase [Pseudomonadota bacterium]MBV1718776.1 NAD(P)/FAD-dependent oxidoreductase [Desulfomicrobium sp.]
MKVEKFDVVVLGSGVAGGHIASRCRKAGLRVALVESNGFGGTCPLHGCEPKKVMADACETVERFNNAQGAGPTGVAQLDWAELMAFKRTFTDGLPARIKKHYDDLGISTFTQPGRFAGPSLVISGESHLEAAHICIATGSTPRMLNIPGSKYLSTSNDFLAMPTLPERIVFIGGGFISFELAHIAAAAGAEVTVVHRSQRFLKKFDANLVERLAGHLEAMGVKLYRDCPPHSVIREGDWLVLKAGTDGSLSMEADAIFNAAGRIPALENLDLPAGNVSTEHGGVAVNSFLQSISNPSVFAAGDVIASSMPLTPVASVEAEIVVQNILDGPRHAINMDVTPYALFTYPPLAAVGMLEEEARKQGLRFDVIDGDSAGWSEYKRIGQQCAGFKLLVEKDSRQLLGAHVLGDRAEETVNLFALAMRTKVDVDELRSMLWAYPSFGYALKYMFR